MGNHVATRSAPAELCAEWARPNERRFVTLGEAQASLDRWVEHYNTERPHQAIGMLAPIERFRLAAVADVDPLEIDGTVEPQPAAPVESPGVRPAGVTRWVDQRGHISLARFSYRVGAAFAGEPVEVVCAGGLVDVFHAGVRVATHANDPTTTNRG